MQAHIAMLAEQYDVTLITSGAAADLPWLPGEHVHFVHVPFVRKISLAADLIALMAVYRLCRKQRFDVVHSIMPKTGLLAMLGATLAGTPHRVHTFTGQVWSNKSGIGRLILKWMDKIIACCATDVLTDSFSQRNFLIAKKIVAPQKISVLGNGSVCGVNVDRFKFNQRTRNQLRHDLHIPADAIVCIFLGRINREKGVSDLVQAFVGMNRQFPQSHLLIVGPDECGMDRELLDIAAPCIAHYSRVGYTERPEDFMSCADIFCLPSYREGFGSVIIEAASVGLPAIASRIYGIIDAVVDGETGILHEAKNIQQIQEALLVMAKNPVLRQTMSTQARQRAHLMFDQACVTDAMRDFYRNLMR